MLENLNLLERQTQDDTIRHRSPDRQYMRKGCATDKQNNHEPKQQTLYGYLMDTYRIAIKQQEEP